MVVIANFEISGFSELEKRLLKRETAAVEAVPEMLKAAAEAVKESQKSEVKARFKSDRSTGDLAESIESTKIENTQTQSFCYVYPQGNNRRGQRNATVGFVLHYGRTGKSAMAPSHWLTAANEKVSSKAQDEMWKVWRKKQNE